VRGRDFDIDGLSVDLGLVPDDGDRVGPLPAVESGVGRSALRFAFARGRHEWVAGPTNGTLYEAHTMTRNRIALFHASGGRILSDDVCLARETCAILDDPARWPWP
jgi:hypothetical protein